MFESPRKVIPQKNARKCFVVAREKFFEDGVIKAASVTPKGVKMGGRRMLTFHGRSGTLRLQFAISSPAVLTSSAHFSRIRPSNGFYEISSHPLRELDLDYLEDPHNRRRNRATTPLKEFSPDSVDLVKVVLLGAPCVGKTSIIQQFVWNEFDDKYVTTDRKHTYYPSVIINDRLYELKISDIPVIPYFPVNAYYEWTDYRFYGLRSATAYILVFDLSNIDTFQYVRTLRDQMIESRDMSDVPVVIVGNKQDLIQCREWGSREGSPENCPIQQGWSEANRQKRDDIVTLVTKHWKCTYIECSAKYNWKVMQLFKEVMEMIDSSCTIQQQGEDFSSAVESALDDNGKPKCVIL